MLIIKRMSNTNNAVKMAQHVPQTLTLIVFFSINLCEFLQL